MHFKWGSGSHSNSVHPVFVLCIIRMTWLPLTNIHLCVCVCLCEFKTQGQNNVVLVPKWGSSCVLPSSDEWGGYGGEGANKASIHCHCHCRKNRETVHTAFHAIYHTATFLCFLFACCLSLHHLCPSLPPPGTNIEHSDRLSLIWFSQQRWPSTLNMSTSLSTASTSHWPLWRRMGWALKTKRRKCCWLGKFDVSSFCLIFYLFYLRLFFNRISVIRLMRFSRTGITHLSCWMLRWLGLKPQSKCPNVWEQRRSESLMTLCYFLFFLPEPFVGREFYNLVPSFSSVCGMLNTHF